MGKLQHYVPRFYLRAWAKDEKIYCLQDGNIRNPNIKNVGAENYFYRLQELSPEDVAFLREGIVKDSPQGLKSSHEELLQAFAAPHLAKKALQEKGLATPEVIAEVDRTIIELNEKFHTSIEESFRPYLAAMQQGDLRFLEDQARTAVFYKGLAVQYARTNHLKKSRQIFQPERFDLYMRIMNPLVHILSSNVGLSLYAERERHNVILLDNLTTVSFITADQPVINIAASPFDTEIPERFELYYPVSPQKAMLLLDPGSDFLPSSTTVSATTVHLYNLKMAAHSYRQTFASSPEPLASVRDDLPAYMSCF